MSGSIAVRSVLWSALSFGSSKLITFVVTLVLARLLVPGDFGVVAAGLTLLAFLEIALDLGVGATVVYEQEKGLSHRVRVACTLNIAIALVLALGGVLASPWIAEFFRTPESVHLFQALFGYLVLRGAGQVQLAVMQRDLRYRERTVVDVTRALVRGVVSLVMALQGAGAWAIVGGLLAGEAVALVVVVAYVPLRPTLRLPRSIVSTLLSFGLSVLALKVVSALVNNADNIVVGGRLGPTELGLYSLAFRLPELCIDSVNWIFSSVAFSLYAKARGQGLEVFRASMLRALRITTLYGFSAGVGLAILAPIAVPVLFSDRWQAAVTPAVLLALAAGLGSVGYASGDIFPALGKPATLLKLTAIMCVLTLVGFWFATPYGIAYVAGVHVVFMVVFAYLRLRAANRLLGSTWPQVLQAMAPAGLSVAGIVLVALPVSLLVPVDVVGLLATVAAGAAGAGLALSVFARPALREVVDLLRRGVR